MDLNPGEVICDECNGKGFYKMNLKDEPIIYLECPKCFGAKKLDWIENIAGKKIKFIDIIFD